VILLDGKDLSKAFPIEGGIWRKRIGQVQALADVSFHISKGETLALVGGSGCGKSTLAKIVAGLLEPDAGELLWEGRALKRFNRLERARKIEMIFQDPYASLNPKLSIETQLHEVLALTLPTDSLSLKGEGYAMPSPFREKVAEGRMRELIESVGLSVDVLSHYPFQFSGGQRQRIAIARALAMGPELLIADEPLSALDVTTQAQILDLFKKLKEEYHLTFLFITHDLAVAQAFSDRIIVLKEGCLVEEGLTRDALQDQKNAYTRQLLSAVPIIPC
jgi:ABC-type glutathione transport system ATPase component